MCVQVRFKGGDSVRGVNVWWERVPEAGGRSAGGSGPRGGSVGRRAEELDGRRGSESAGGCVDMDQFREI